MPVQTNKPTARQLADDVVSLLSAAARSHARGPSAAAEVAHALARAHAEALRLAMRLPPADVPPLCDWPDEVLVALVAAADEAAFDPLLCAAAAELTRRLSPGGLAA